MKEEDVNLRPKGLLFWGALFAAVGCLAVAYGPVAGFVGFIVLAAAILKFG